MFVADSGHPAANACCSALRWRRLVRWPAPAGHQRSSASRSKFRAPSAFQRQLSGGPSGGRVDSARPRAVARGRQLFGSVIVTAWPGQLS